MSENNLTTEEIQQLTHLAKKVLWTSPEIRKQLQDQKVNVVPANFYSNIPLVDDIKNSFEYKGESYEPYNNGLFNKEKIESFIKSIAIYAEEFNPPLEKAEGTTNQFYWKNPAFSYADAMAYYCILRHFKPTRLFEIGSGYSTLVANQALLANGKGNIMMIEPYPMDFLKSLETVDQIIEKFAQDIPVTDFVDLVESADVWFIDSTHTVKIGSDCLYIYLKVMPNITKEILVHTHDVYLPYGMPQKSALERHIYWTEQYLLYAYMLDNPKVDIKFSSIYAKRTMPESTKSLMQNKYHGGGASIWYTLNENSKT
ncbi:MAG: class I SAM-dependent methyltransferase [Chloroflexota bacterium]